MDKALIVYGTRYGAAASTAEEIAKTLHQEGWDVQVVNAKEEKVKNLAEYDLVVVGNGIQINKWTGEPEDFLKSSRRNWRKRKCPCSYAVALPLRQLVSGKQNLVRLKRLEENTLKKKQPSTVYNPSL